MMVQREDPEMHDTGRDETVDVLKRLRRCPAGGRIEDIDPLFRFGHGVDRAGVLRGQVHAQGNLPQAVRQVLADPPLVITGRGKMGPLLKLVDGDLRRVGHFPLDLAPMQLLPLPPQPSFPRIRVPAPAADFMEKAPLVAGEVIIEPSDGVPGKQDVQRDPKDLLQVKIEGPGGPMEVDVGIEVQPGVQEAAERRNPRLVEREAVLREEAVKPEPRDVHQVQRKSGHVGVPLDVVQVVHRVDAGEELPQELKPPGPGFSAFSGHPDQVGDLAGIEAFPFRERPRGAAPNAADDPAQLPVDDLLAQDLVGQPVLIEKMVVEEMAVGPVPHVVKQSGQTEQLLHAMRRGGVGADLAKAGVEGPAEFPGHVHRSQGMLEAAVLGRRIDPARALKLADPPQPLHPGGIDQVLLRGFR